MPSCHYAARDDPTKLLSAKHFGYWSLRWSDDAAMSSLSRLQANPFASIPGVKSSLARAYEIKSFLIALHAGAHWAFAAAVPMLFRGLRTDHFTETLVEPKAGCEDASRELCLPNGKLVPTHVSQFVAVLTGNFFQDLLGDLSDDALRASGAIIPVPKRAGVRFVKLLEDNFSAAFTDADVVVVGPLIDPIAQSTMDSLGELFTVSVPS